MEQQAAHILVVDDEAAIRLTMNILLRRNGYIVTTAESGEQALDLIARQPFDLLLLDLKMPGASGLDVAESAREAQPAAAILILTGSTPIDGVALDSRLEQYDYMLKTASPPEVLARIAAALD